MLRWLLSILGISALAFCTGCDADQALVETDHALAAKVGAPEPLPLGALPTWESGLAEMMYYDAERVIYDTPRSYTLVALTVREFHDDAEWVKTTREGGAPVLKLLIAEETPANNYNYRFTTTLIADRATLAPRALTSTSQEWCGTTYCRAIWADGAATLREYSYMDDRGERELDLPTGALPIEVALLHARDLVARQDYLAEQPARLWLPTARTIRWWPVEEAVSAVWRTKGRSVLATPAGSFDTVRLILDPTADAGEASDADGGDSKARAAKRLLAEVWVEAARPHRVIRFEIGDTKATLAGTESRPYWDSSSRSRFYERGAAP